MAIPNGYIPIRSWFEGQGQKVNWDQNTKTINAGNFTFKPGDYIEQNGISYINPTKLAGSYLSQPQQQLNQQTLQPYIDTAKSIYEPTYNTRSEALQRALNNISSQAENQRRLAEVAFQSSRSALQRQETQDEEKARRSAIARGTYSSGLYDHAQQELDKAYAPEYQQLESNKAANLANIASQAALASENLASQTKDLEAQMMQNIMTTALQNFQQGQTGQSQKTQQLANYLLNLGQLNNEQEKYQSSPEAQPWYLDLYKQSLQSDIAAKNRSNRPSTVSTPKDTLSKNATNNAIAQVYTYKSKDEALTALSQYGQAMANQGIDLQAVYKAIESRWPY